MKKTLDRYERSIEQSADDYKPVPQKSRRRIEKILGKVRKSRNINIRISEEVLAALKKRSVDEGIPYQTLISSVLHKFVTNQLVDERAISKSIRLLTSKRRKEIA